jgi:hypothetical protein
MAGAFDRITSAKAEEAAAIGCLLPCSADLLSWSRLFKSFVAAPVQFRFPFSFRPDVVLKRSMGAHRMFGKMAVLVLAKSEKKLGARIQNRGQ